MKKLISLKDATVRYKISGNIFRKNNHYEALRSVGFDINQGETLGILGRNGSGKSTLLRLISGVIQPDSGLVINHGASVALLSLKAAFDFNLNGKENTFLTGLLQGYSKQGIESKIDAIKEYSELGDSFFDPIRTYSTGMLARLGFSIATIMTPDVLLIDEILGVGDLKFREKSEKTMIEKVSSQQTVVLVSHSLNQIQRLCDRVAIIKDGSIIDIGETDRIIQRYQEIQ